MLGTLMNYSRLPCFHPKRSNKAPNAHSHTAHAFYVVFILVAVLQVCGPYLLHQYTITAAAAAKGLGARAKPWGRGGQGLKARKGFTIAKSSRPKQTLSLHHDNVYGNAAARDIDELFMHNYLFFSMVGK